MLRRNRQYRQAVAIALDVEQQIYEANTFLNAASMMSKIGRV